MPGYPQPGAAAEHQQPASLGEPISGDLTLDPPGGASLRTACTNCTTPPAALACSSLSSACRPSLPTALPTACRSLDIIDQIAGVRLSAALGHACRGRTCIHVRSVEQTDTDLAAPHPYHRCSCLTAFETAPAQALISQTLVQTEQQQMYPARVEGSRPLSHSLQRACRWVWLE